jgi:hypothetical protein
MKTQQHEDIDRSDGQVDEISELRSSKMVTDRKTYCLTHVFKEKRVLKEPRLLISAGKRYDVSSMCCLVAG